MHPMIQATNVSMHGGILEPHKSDNGTALILDVGVTYSKGILIDSTVLNNST